MSINTITPTFNNHVPTNEIDRIKAKSDAKNDTEDLTFPPSKNGLIKSRACIAYGDALERKMLRDELKEIWEH